MAQLAITGSSGTLGLRLLAFLSERQVDQRHSLGGGGSEIVGFDVRPMPPHAVVPSGYRHVLLDLTSEDLKGHLHDTEVLVHLGEVAAGEESGRDFGASVNVGCVRNVLEACGDANVSQVVLLSSAAVYGAWPDNPVPLTEDAPLRPNTEFSHAAQKSEIERMGSEWRDGHPGARLTILRPAPILGAPGTRAWLARVTQPGLGDRITQNVTNRQYVHVDDVASAVVHIIDNQLAGTFNVSSNGWISGDDAPALLGPNLRLPLPDQASRWISALAAKRESAVFGRVCGVAPYARYSWVVSNDRLRATGWLPRSTSEEALVGSEAPSALNKFFRKHRQEVTFAAVLIGIFAVALAGWSGWLRWRRSRLR